MKHGNICEKKVPYLPLYEGWFVISTTVFEMYFLTALGRGQSPGHSHGQVPSEEGGLASGTLVPAGLVVSGTLVPAGLVVSGRLFWGNKSAPVKSQSVTPSPVPLLLLEGFWQLLSC